MRIGRRIAAFAVSAVLLAACGSSGSASSSGGPAPTSAQIRPQLLTLSDMPAGWASAPNPKDNSSPTDQVCSGRLHSIRRTKGPEAQVTFTAATSSFVPAQLEESVDYDPAASTDFDRAKSILDACHSAEEQGVTLSIGQLSFPALGDQSSAWLISGSESIVSISAPIVIVRKGNYVMLLALASGSNETSTLEGIAKTAVGKMA